LSRLSIPKWQALFKELDMKMDSNPSYFALPNSMETTLPSLWKKSGLSATKVQVPEGIRGGSLDHEGSALYSIEDKLFDNRLLVQKIAAPLLPFVIQGKVNRMKTSKDQLNEVDVTLQDGSKVTFKPKLVIVAVGTGLQALLKVCMLTFISTIYSTTYFIDFL
jgi:hypothetical protein